MRLFYCLFFSGHPSHLTFVLLNNSVLVTLGPNRTLLLNLRTPVSASKFILHPNIKWKTNRFQNFFIIRKEELGTATAS